MDLAFAQQYSDLEKKHWWFRARRRILKTILASIPWPPKPRILEIGIGSGENLYEIYPPDAQLVGVEPEASNAELARKKGPIPVYVATAEQLPSDIADASLNAITLFDVLEHIESDLATLENLKRKLCPGGYLILAVPAYRWLWGQQDDISHHFRRYTRNELHEKLNRAGFKPLRITYFNTFLFPPIALFRLAAKLKPQRHKKVDTDFKYTLGIIDKFLYFIFSTEAYFLKRMNFPFGISILAIAQKP